MGEERGTLIDLTNVCIIYRGGESIPCNRILYQCASCNTLIFKARTKAVFRRKLCSEESYVQVKATSRRKLQRDGKCISYFEHEGFHTLIDCFGCTEATEMPPPALFIARKMLYDGIFGKVDQ